MEQTKVIKPETLDDLIKTLYKIYENDSVNVEEVKKIMKAYKNNPEEWKKFALFDPNSAYSRNLVDDGNGKFNLMILCWNEGKKSSEIHNHTHAHCFMKLLKGEITETLFEWPNDKLKAEMVQTSQRVLHENDCAYIDDSIGLHRMENVSETESAVSLHLYSPPYQSCQIFDQDTGKAKEIELTFWSKHGKRT